MDFFRRFWCSEKSRFGCCVLFLGDVLNSLFIDDISIVKISVVIYKKGLRRLKKFTRNHTVSMLEYKTIKCAGPFLNYSFFFLNLSVGVGR